MSVPSDPFFRLPTELCCTILRDWLLLKCTVHLDSAACCKVKRLLLWDTVFTSSQCIVPQTKHLGHGQDIFNWLSKRKLRTTGFVFTWDVDDDECEYLGDYGDSIRTLQFVNCNACTYMPLVSQHCKNVDSLIFVKANLIFT